MNKYTKGQYLQIRGTDIMGKVLCVTRRKQLNTYQYTLLVHTLYGRAITYVKLEAELVE